MTKELNEYDCDNNEKDGGTFFVLQKEGKWYWEFSPVWEMAGPFDTKQKAIAAGRKCQMPDGSNYFT